MCSRRSRCTLHTSGTSLDLCDTVTCQKILAPSIEKRTLSKCKKENERPSDFFHRGFGFLLFTSWTSDRGGADARACAWVSCTPNARLAAGSLPENRQDIRVYVHALKCPRFCKKSLPHYSQGTKMRPLRRTQTGGAGDVRWSGTGGRMKA